MELSGQEYVDVYAAKAKESAADASASSSGHSAVKEATAAETTARAGVPAA